VLFFKKKFIFYFFWNEVQGHLFPLCRPIYAISEREVIKQGWGGMSCPLCQPAAWKTSYFLVLVWQTCLAETAK